MGDILNWQNQFSTLGFSIRRCEFFVVFAIIARNCSWTSTIQKCNQFWLELLEIRENDWMECTIFARGKRSARAVMKSMEISRKMEAMKILKMSKRSILTVVVVVTSQNTDVQRYNSLVNGKRR